MINYDFRLGEKAKTAAKKQVQAQSANIIDGTITIQKRFFYDINRHSSNYQLGFAVSKSHQKRMNKKIYTVDVPSSYTPRNWALRKTRFGPAIAQPSSSTTEDGHKRHILTAEERGELLNEKTKPKEKLPTTETLQQTSALPTPEIIVKTEPDVIVTPNTSDAVTKAPERRALNFIKLPDSLNFDR